MKIVSPTSSVFKRSHPTFWPRFRIAYQRSPQLPGSRRAAERVSSLSMTWTSLPFRSASIALASSLRSVGRDVGPSFNRSALALSASAALLDVSCRINAEVASCPWGSAASGPGDSKDVADTSSNRDRRLIGRSYPR